MLETMYASLRPLEQDRQERAVQVHRAPPVHREDTLTAASSRSLNRLNGWMIPAQWTKPSTAPKRAITAGGSASTAARSAMFTTWVADPVGSGGKARGLRDRRLVDVHRRDPRPTPDRLKRDLAAHAAPRPRDYDDLVVKLHSITSDLGQTGTAGDTIAPAISAAHASMSGQFRKSPCGSTPFAIGSMRTTRSGNDRGGSSGSYRPRKTRWSRAPMEAASSSIFLRPPLPWSGCRTERIRQRVARVLAARRAGQRTAAEEPDRSCSEQCRVVLRGTHRGLLEPVAHVDRAPDDEPVDFADVLVGDLVRGHDGRRETLRPQHLADPLGDPLGCAMSTAVNDKHLAHDFAP